MQGFPSWIKTGPRNVTTAVKATSDCLLKIINQGDGEAAVVGPTLEWAHNINGTCPPGDSPGCRGAAEVLAVLSHA